MARSSITYKIVLCEFGEVEWWTIIPINQFFIYTMPLPILNPSKSTTIMPDRLQDLLKITSPVHGGTSSETQKRCPAPLLPQCKCTPLNVNIASPRFSRFESLSPHLTVAPWRAGTLVTAHHTPPSGTGPKDIGV